MIMSSFDWDRLLETCHTNDADLALLVPGSPPLIRIADSWRALQVPALTSDEIVDLAAQQLHPKPDAQTDDGYAYSDFQYRDVALFRAMAFGFPQTKLLVLSRFAQPPPPPRPDSPSPN
jgi:hypothetical protein